MREPIKGKFGEVRICDNMDPQYGLPSLKDKSFDIVFTSPPFKDEDISEEYWSFHDRFFKEAMRVCAKVFILIQSEQRMIEIIKRYPEPKRILIWGKLFSQYSFRYNPIFIYQLDEKYNPNRYIWSDTFGIEAINGGGKYHKYQDPDLLYLTLLKMFKGCKTVLEPFSGSATTEMVCEQLGKSYLGYEIDESNIPTITKRINNGIKKYIPSLKQSELI